LISHEHKFVFIHIPKTAGSSIELFFEKKLGVPKNQCADPKGCPGIHYDELTDDICSEYFMFTFVRNPWARMVSLHKYWFFNRPYYNRRIGHLPKDFKYFCDNTEHVFDHLPSAERVHILPQVDLNGNGDCMKYVDYVGRFENLKEDFNIICDKLGVSGVKRKLRHRRSSHTKKPYWEYYDDETRQIVAEKYAKDIEYFGYKFGED